MGKWYHVVCDQCGYEQTFSLGQGKDSQETAQAVLDDLISSDDGARMLDFINRSAETSVHIERSLYRCRFCGQLQVRM